MQENGLLEYEKISTSSTLDSARTRKKCVLTVESPMELVEGWRRIKYYGVVFTVQCVFHCYEMKHVWCICNRKEQQRFTDSKT
jgi:hypothetical protein